MNARIWTTIALLILAHLGLDIVLPWFMLGGPHDTLVWPLIGICVAQVNLIALWAALAPGGIAWRLPWATLLVSGMWYALVIGIRLIHGRYPRGEAIMLGGILLVGLLLAQLPLWVAAKIWRHRFYPPRAEASLAGTARQYNLRQLMIGMGLLSVILGVARWVLPPGDWWQVRFTVEMFIVLAIVSVVNLGVTLPAIWILSIRELRGIAISLCLLIPYCIFITMMELLVIGIAMGRSGPSDNWMGLFLFNAGQIFAVVATLGVLRWQGFRLLTESAWEDERQLAKAAPPLDKNAALQSGATSGISPDGQPQ